ncbi:MAG: response regulator [Brasilonema octagenarum HA4186-MV1]|jgi:DNA-binding response OmpR family regulator|uniref:Response regulator n=2 Tax=Brasilonema TaxID=383614 RepID=A0A856ME90_9CYAN|nr:MULTISPECIES: response regulator [Brasilonema]MBW4625339.1 response regulator [Brasilonema octagenarum HA4186-MV1]NMF66212.1 response regulator [Brasilonema octagenarum UFV-OR1]QDL09513.1 response regulator [Brasilonema sennae CENA114]QDL15869.1 response regulator [Brasilonema octagenarum UFV-E1]
MFFETALQLIEANLETKTGKHLTSPEKEILKAAWNNEPYNTVADSLYLSVGYIKDLAYPLWQQLSDLFEKKVTKNNFRNILTEQSAKSILTPTEIAACDIEQNLDPKGNILILDDVVENLQVLTEILTKKGYKVRCVTNAVMAFKTINHNPPDVILLDIKMPSMDGYQVCATLKADVESAQIPVIFLSALEETIDKIKAFEIGGLDYITKPFEPEEVIARIQTQLTIQQQKRQLREEIQQHQQTAEILYQSRALLASVLDTSRDGIAAMQVVRDMTTGEVEDFRYLVVNPALAKLLGKKREDLMGTSMQKTRFNQLIPRLFDLLAQVVETGQALEQKFYWSNDNIQKWYDLTAIKLGDGCSINIRQISEIHQMNSPLTQIANLV